LARACAETGVSINSAHIDTFGERASDVFYVQELGGGQMTDPRRRAVLQDELEQVLRAAEPAAPSDPAKAPLAVAPASTAR
jgi:[protein-PII] uridylyltransferase